MHQFKYNTVHLLTVFTRSDTDCTLFITNTIVTLQLVSFTIVWQKRIVWSYKKNWINNITLLLVGYCSCVGSIDGDRTNSSTNQVHAVAYKPVTLHVTWPPPLGICDCIITTDSSMQRLLKTNWSLLAHSVLSVSWMTMTYHKESCETNVFTFHHTFPFSSVSFTKDILKICKGFVK